MAGCPLRAVFGNLVIVVAFGTLLPAQECADITKYGIFDVQHTKTQSDFVQDLISWLSTNEFLSEAQAKNAALKVGIVIPDINIPVNADGTYGESHSKTWSKAAEQYFRNHTEAHASFESDVTKANPNIVAAWQACVTRAKGLVCWARQTPNPKEVLLSMELRPVATTQSSLSVRVRDVQYSSNLASRTRNFSRRLGFSSTTSYLFSRKPGSEYAEASNFLVETNDPDYQCTAAAPSLPPLPSPPTAPCHEDVSHLSADCVRDSNQEKYVGQGAKTVFYFECGAPAPGIVIGAAKAYSCEGGAPCSFLDRLETEDEVKNNVAQVRFQSNSGAYIKVTTPIYYDIKRTVCAP